MARSHRFTMVMTEEEMEMLEELAEEDTRSAASWIRGVIKVAHESTFPGTPAKKKKATKG